MRELAPIRTDILVIGQGAAGLLAATLLARENNEVLVVGDGAPATSLSCGCISFVRDDVLEEDGGRLDVETLARSVYPFNEMIEAHDFDFQDTVSGVSAFIGRQLADQGLEMSDNLFRVYRLITNAGTIHQCSLAPLPVNAGGLRHLAGKRTALLGFEGMGDLDPDLAVRMLRGARGAGEFRAYRAALPALGGRAAVSATEASLLLRSDAAVAEVADAVGRIGEDNVGLPPLFRLDDFQKGMARLRRATGRNVFEVVTPLSLPGQRFQEALERMASGSGCSLLRNRRVGRLEVKGRRLTEASLVTRTRTQKVRFNACVVATGDLIGGGLVASGLEIGDALGTFKVGKVKRSGLRSHSGLRIPAMVKDAAESGFLVEGDMRLQLAAGGAAENAFGAGSALAGFSFPTGVGLGGGLLTAWVAAISAKEAG
jgi:anaerobic glycerol-3-phosphate dehydrogenase